MQPFLSQTSEYALRAMVWLANESPNSPTCAKDLSEGSGVPIHYLSKVLRRLVLADLLTSRKGLGGGFALARSPSEIPFSDILKAVDAYPSLDRCAFGWGACNSQHPCPLHDSVAGLGDNFRQWADSTTLQDTVGKMSVGDIKKLHGES